MTLARKTIAALTLSAGLAAPALADEPDTLVTVVTSGDAQVQLMSMVLTNQAMAQGHPVHILLCGPGGDIALKDAPESATAGQPPKGMSPQGLLQAAMQKGAKAEVCAIYLPGEGTDATALIEGVGVAQPPAMAKIMADDDNVIWSF